MKKFMEEFKKFALKGNVMDMAIGVIIGGAFTAIVTALTTSFINPLIQAITGHTAEDGTTLVGGTFTINGAVFDYGAFITAVINFIILALILFCFLKGINKLMTIGKKKEEAAPLTRKCPYCCTEISVKACKCPNCTSDVEPTEKED